MSEESPPVPPRPNVAGDVRTVIYMPQTPRRSIVGAVFRYIGMLIILCSFVLNFLLIEIALLSAPADGKLEEEHVAGPTEAEAKVGIISISGTISGTRDGIYETGNLNYVIEQLEQARDDKRVVGVVLEVNSPGGSLTASDEILNAVEKIRASGKKVVVWMGSLAASGGYYVSCKADRIVASPTAITGSIGVIAMLANLEDLAEKVGVRVVVFKSGEYKDIGSPFREMKPEEKAQLQHIVDEGFMRFKRMVSEGRGLPMDEVEKLANGSVYTAKDALTLKLVDEIGYLEDAVSEAQGSHMEAKVVRYSKSHRLLSLLFGRSNAANEVKLHVETPLSELRPGIYYLWLPGAMMKD